MEYCSHSWAGAACHIELFNKLQRRAIRLVNDTDLTSKLAPQCLSQGGLYLCFTDSIINYVHWPAKIGSPQRNWWPCTLLHCTFIRYGILCPTPCSCLNMTYNLSREGSMTLLWLTSMPGHDLSWIRDSKLAGSPLPACVLFQDFYQQKNKTTKRQKPCLVAYHWIEGGDFIHMFRILIVKIYPLHL